MDYQLDSYRGPLRRRGPELPVTRRLTILDIADRGH
jgi:hypothetical protein